MPLASLARAAARLSRNLVKYVALRDVSIRSDRFGRELMAELAVRFVAENRIEGAYLEFGVFQGSTFAQFYHLFRRYGLRLPMVAFDSFQGLPAPGGVDASPGYDHFHGGEFTCTREAFVRALAARWVPPGSYTIVPGFYEDTLAPELSERLSLPAAAIVWIDCVLYESARAVLAFLGPLLQDGTILIFNDYYRFRGSPRRGERRAFAEFLSAHSELDVTDYARFGSAGQAFIVHVGARPADAGLIAASAPDRVRPSRDWEGRLQG